MKQRNVLILIFIILDLVIATLISGLINISVHGNPLNPDAPDPSFPFSWFLLVIGILFATNIIMFIFPRPRALGQRLLNWMTHRGSNYDFSCTLHHKLSGHTDVVWNIKWSPDGKMLASSALDNTICLWYYEQGTEKTQPLTMDMEGYLPVRTLEGHTAIVWSMEWSPDGEILASGSLDGSIRLWETTTGTLLHTLSDPSMNQIVCLSWASDGQTLTINSLDGAIHVWSLQEQELRQIQSGHLTMIGCMAWSPDGHNFAFNALDNTVRIQNPYTGDTRVFHGHTSQVACMAWSPDGKMLASGSSDDTIRLWDPITGHTLFSLRGHTSQVTCMTWSPDGKVLASGSSDNTIRLWDPITGSQTNILEGHVDSIRSLSFSTEGRLLTSFSQQDFPYARGNFRIWHTNSWNLVYSLGNINGISPAIFHPESLVLATCGQKSTDINVWDVNLPLPSLPLRTERLQEETIHYRNAKVVLVGDSGVGKTGLGQVLSGKPFVLTESTHGRNVWTFGEQKVRSNPQNKETREILLWDLAGQPGYRLIHQLHLNEVSVALVVFDSRNETDPFIGVDYWNRALQQAHSQGNTTHPLQKLLVAARIDRGSINASAERIQTLVKDLHFQRYFATSAKEGHQIDELKIFIKQAIDWEQLPSVSSTSLFLKIKEFFLVQKKAGRLLSTEDDLFQLFQGPGNDFSSSEDLRIQFDVCLGRVEAAGLIKRLNFGKLVLLQPELIDAYASALINAVRDQPDGLGYIKEEQVRDGNFRMPEDERIPDKEQERLLRIAMVEDLLRYELVLREDALLIFPSQSTRENPDLPDPEKKSVIFDFEGPILNIYATLAVRLANSDFFNKKDIWKNAITYTTGVGGTYGIFLRLTGEGRGESTLFFDEEANEQTCFSFEEYVDVHLQRKALAGSVKRRRIFTCSECGVEITEKTVSLRRQRGFDWLKCSVCGTSISLLDREQRLHASVVSLVPAMDREADQQREREITISILQGREENKEFDVFLCHNGADKPAIKNIGELLKERGILPWLDERELRPGEHWQPLIEQQIAQIKVVAVFLGQNGIGSWQQMELEAFSIQSANGKCRIIPVLLPDAPEEPQIPFFLKQKTWVDFRIQDPDPLNRLIWGITGEQGEA